MTARSNYLGVVITQSPRCKGVRTAPPAERVYGAKPVETAGD